MSALVSYLASVNIHGVIDNTAGPQDRTVTRGDEGKVLTRPHVTWARPQVARTSACSEHPCGKYDVDSNQIRGGSRRGLAGRDPSTLRAFCAFGQLLSPRVFLTQLSGRRRVGAGQRKVTQPPGRLRNSTDIRLGSSVRVSRS